MLIHVSVPVSNSINIHVLIPVLIHVSVLVFVPSHASVSVPVLTGLLSVRSWQLQGSKDGLTWTVLSEHNQVTNLDLLTDLKRNFSLFNKILIVLITKGPTIFC